MFVALAGGFFWVLLFLGVLRIVKCIALALHVIRLPNIVSAKFPVAWTICIPTLKRYDLLVRHCLSLLKVVKILNSLCFRYWRISILLYGEHLKSILFSLEVIVPSYNFQKWNFFLHHWFLHHC